MRCLFPSDGSQQSLSFTEKQATHTATGEDEPAQTAGSGAVDFADAARAIEKVAR